MNNLLIWIFLICIWNSILFFGKSLGISVILFIVPLLYLIYYVLKSSKQIKNKYGLLFIIPILLLSFSYLIFNNWFLNLLNIPVIIVLFLLMYIFTIRPSSNFFTVFLDCFYLLVEPLDNVTRLSEHVEKKLKHKIELSEKNKQLLFSLIIIIPIVIFILMLLSSADMMFEKIFSSFFKVFENIYLPTFILNSIERIIIVAILFVYLSVTIFYISKQYHKLEHQSKEYNFSNNSNSFNLLLTILNIIYLVFDIIQIRSLLLHQVSMDITYAEYARQGFFQLMIVSVINVSIILISKFFEQKEDNNYSKIMCLIMVLLTFVIIVSSFLRMYMYESEFGYTLLRLLVYVVLITETILLIPTIIYVFNSKLKILNYYMVIIISVYVILNYINVDYMIAYRNIDRYYETHKIDLLYLQNYKTDNVPLLVDLYNNTNNPQYKQELKEYLLELDCNIDGFQEFNISKYKAQKEIEKLND